MPTTTFQQNVDGYTGTFDTMLRESRPQKSYASAANVNVDGSDSSGQQNQGLIYFSDIFGVGPGQVPEGAAITSATLTLQVNDGTADAFSLHRMLTNWMDLSKWTWNSFVGGIQTDGVESLGSADLSLSGISSGTQTLDVTTSVQAWSDGAVNFGWAFLMSGSNGWDISSSEGAFAPKLSVTYEIPGPPVPLILVTESDGSTLLYEGGNGDTLSVALSTAPTSDVTITVTASTLGDVAISPATLTFTPQNWQDPQIVALAAIDDDLVETTEEIGIVLAGSSADPAYDGRTITVASFVYDNDVAVLPPLTPTVLAAHDTTAYTAGDPSGYGSGDPSGLAYVPELDLLFIADSEHNESPYYSPVNLFATRLDGTFVRSYSMQNFTSEPTGLAYNSRNGFLYITDDDADRIFWVDPNDPTQSIGQINTKDLGIFDAEDPVIDPITGNIFLLDGALRTLFELTERGEFVRSFVLPDQIKDPEALAYDASLDVFYIAGGATRGTIFRVDRNGDLIDSTDILNSYRNPITGIKPKIKGLELAPSSDPDDGGRMSLYVADYGVDQIADGRVFEVDLYSEWTLF